MDVWAEIAASRREIADYDIRRPLGAPALIPGNRAEAILDFPAKSKAQGFVATLRSRT